MEITGRHRNGDKSTEQKGETSISFCLFNRHAILIGATIAHKGIQDRITGGYKFKVRSC